MNKRYLWNLPSYQSMKCGWTLLLLLIAILWRSEAYGQQDLAIGQWQAHVPFHRYFDLTQSADYIYVACERGLIKLQKSDDYIETMTKVEGLSEVEPKQLVFDESTQSLLILYANGNIDVLTENGITNVPTLVLNTTITQSKTPLQVRLDGTGSAYLVYEFGMLKFDLLDHTFEFSLLVDFVIHDMAIYHDMYYIATDNGIYRTSIAPSVNHADILVWEKVSLLNRPDFTSHAILNYQDKLLADIDGVIYDISDMNDPILFHDVSNDDYAVRGIHPLREGIAIVYRYDHEEYRNDRIYMVNRDGLLLMSHEQSNCASITHRIIQTQTGRVLWADDERLLTAERVQDNCYALSIDVGPPTIHAYEVAIDQDQVVVATGALTDKGIPLHILEGISIYKDHAWSQFNYRDGFFGDSVRIITDVAIAPNGTIAMGSYLRGLVLRSADGSHVQLLNRSGDCIEGQKPIPETSTISELKYDSRGRLWICNFRANFPLKMIDENGDCHIFERSSQFGVDELLEMTIDDRGYKWITSKDAATGIVVFDEGDISDASDDRFLRINTNNSALLTNITNDIATDLDGDVWVGTDQGVVVFECPNNLIEAGCAGRRPIVIVDGVAAELLVNERVNAVAIDGANRKWFGTNHGIFVQSANGQEEVARFDVQNSPLLSDQIIDIAIDEKTGEVWIVTALGLMTYRTNATHGDAFYHQPASDVFAYPNPVRPEYNGPIAIKGLPRDARFKITDVRGQLVFEGIANGGQAIWDGLRPDGRRVASGVYLVFSTSHVSFERPDAMVTKILVIQ